MEDLLDCPSEASELYVARGTDVTWTRPLMQGDVFEALEIAGLEDGPGLAMITTHPCSMRKGPKMRPLISMARLIERQSIGLEKWRDGFFDYMPLPELIPETPRTRILMADLSQSGLVATKTVLSAIRIACLSDVGIELLQQRRAHLETRIAIKLESIHKMLSPVFNECELSQDWAEAALASEQSSSPRETIRLAEDAFQEWLSEDESLRRKMLQDERKRSALRRDARKEMQERYKSRS